MITFMMWTGVTASADEISSVADDAVTAISDLVDPVLDTAIEVSLPDATVSAGGGVSVDLSSDASDGVFIDSPMGGELEIGLPFAQAADDAVVVDGVMVYDNNNGSSTTPLVHVDGSVQILTTIADANAPTEYTYVVEAASSGGLVLREDGRVDVVGVDGFVVSHVLAPWAVDADGRAVPTRFSVDGFTVTQVVDHVPGVAYPVVADPKFTSTWWNKTLYFNKTESAVVAAGTSDVFGQRSGGGVLQVNTYEIVMSVAFAGVSLAIQHSLPVRGFAWRHPAARLPLAAQLVMGFVLAAGLFWSDDTQRAALLLASWLVGTVIGVLVLTLRPQTPRAGADTNAASHLDSPR